MPRSTTTVRLAPNLIESLKVEASRDSRSLNNLINKVLSNFIEQEETNKDHKLKFDEAMKKAF